MKRKKAVILVFISFSLIFIVCIFAKVSNISPVSNLLDNDDDIIVVLDSGHGGEDPGAIGVNGVVESDINLQFTKKLKLFLNLNGYKTVMIREDNNDISDKSLDSIAARKKSDMYKRLEIYNSNIHNVAISIHQNIFPADSCKGTQVFYSRQAPSAKDLADNITESVKNNLQKDNQRISKETNNSIFLLDNAKIPAVIVECGFLSNKEEVLILCDKEYQRKFSFCILQGLMNTKF